MRLLVTILAAVALVPQIGAGAAEPSGDAAAAQKLYTAKCARCHKFYDPAAYDDAKWGAWMAKMKKKSRLTDEQYATLSRYLQSLRSTAQ